MLRVETIAIGDELLTGKISDTNSSYIAKQIFRRGVALASSTVIPDRADVIKATLSEVGQRADFVICFGGLGPTSDDITAEVVAECLNCQLVEDAPSKAKLLSYLVARNRTPNVHTMEQVLFPEKSRPLENFEGFAVGFEAKLGKARFFFLPGVPAEMMAMAERHIFPEIEKALGAEKLEQLVWRLIGIPESEVQKLMVDIESRLPKGAWLGYRTRPPENYLYLYSQEASEALREKTFQTFGEEISRVVSSWCYSRSEEDLEFIIYDLLHRQKKTLVLAESCTGGAVVERLTQVPGISEHLFGSYVTYQVAAKAQMLNVKLQKEEDAVSQDCSRRLALAAREKSGADIAGAITGYLGPGGGTPENPVGTVYVCVVDRSGVVAESRTVLFGKRRALLQWAAASYLLNTLRQALQK